MVQSLRRLRESPSQTAGPYIHIGATPNFSGIYLPGKNWYAVLSYIWDKGGDIAVQEDGEWVGQLDSPESVAGLEYFKQVFDEANAAPADSDDAQDFTAFCNGEVGMMPAPGWKPGQIIDPEQGCPEMEPNIGVFALPGSEAGSTAPVFLGGSVLAIPTKSDNQELAYHVLGDDQARDVTILALPEHPDWMIGCEVSDDGGRAILSISSGCEPVNRVWILDLDAVGRRADGALDFSPFAHGAAGSRELPLNKLVDEFKVREILGWEEKGLNQGSTLWR